MQKLQWRTRGVVVGPVKKWLGVATLAFGLCLTLGAGAATFSASLDRDTITLGEMATLSLAFGGGQPQSEPAPPEIPNLQIAYVGPSSQFSVINGQVSSSITYNFRVFARQAGEYRIPAMTVDVGGEKLASQPLILRVLKPSAPTASAVSSGTQPAFLRLVVPRKEAYVGETCSAQLQLYVAGRIGLERFQLTGFPVDGFNAGKMMEGQHYQTQISNTVYTVIPVNVPLLALKQGTFSLGPVTASAVLDVPSPNRRRDPFFDMFGGGTEQREVALATEPATVQLLALPRENVPATFNGAVGNYTMQVTAGPTNLAAGDPITVKVQISGRGSIDSLSLPEQAIWQNFKTFPPTTKVETTDPLGLQGTKTFEQIVSPESADVKSLPALSFSFFDPEKKVYRTLTQPPLPLLVRPGGSTPAPSVTVAARSKQDTPPPAQDIVPNKQRLGAVAQIGPPLIQQPWFLALQSFPLLAFFGAVVWRRRADHLANNPRLRRQRQVAHLIREGLAELRQLAAENKSDAFFATLVRLLQERLGERLDLPATAITEAVIDERLLPLGVSNQVLSPLQELFQTCNLARYAPIKSSQELTAIIPKLEAVLHDLQALNV